MNPGILTPPTQFATMPRGLLGRPTPVPMPDQFWHPEALNWQDRVRRNGGSVAITTLAAVSWFCNAIDAAGIRDRFYRLSLFCGDQLAAALVPLYRAESATASVRGNATDTNNNFVSADYANIGPLSGLRANGTNKYLNTGLLTGAFSASNVHMGVGLRAAATVTGYRAALGANAGGVLELSISTRRGDGSSFAGIFGPYNDSATHAGEVVFSSPLGVGDLIAAWPSFYRNGVRVGATATASQTGTVAYPFFVFAFNNFGTPSGYSDIRSNWYSLGLTMNNAQAAAFTSAISAFNVMLGRL